MAAKKVGPVKPRFTAEQRLARKQAQLKRVKKKGWKPPPKGKG